jgi:hypothetical protein
MRLIQLTSNHYSVFGLPSRRRRFMRAVLLLTQVLCHSVDREPNGSQLSMCLPTTLRASKCPAKQRRDAHRLAGDRQEPVGVAQLTYISSAKRIAAFVF